MRNSEESEQSHGKIVQVKEKRKRRINVQEDPISGWSANAHRHRDATLAHGGTTCVNDLPFTRIVRAPGLGCCVRWTAPAAPETGRCTWFVSDVRYPYPEK